MWVDYGRWHDYLALAGVPGRLLAAGTGQTSPRVEGACLGRGLLGARPSDAGPPWTAMDSSSQIGSPDSHRQK